MEEIDRISKLPEPILQHIMSFLVVKDAANTSLVSQAWSGAWSSLSSLNFGNNPFEGSERIVDRILAKRKEQKISIQKFRIVLPNNWEVYDDWIKVLVSCNIKHLHLNVRRTQYNKSPEPVFAAKSLEVLFLGGIKLELPSDGIKFSSLRELYLVDSCLDERLLKVLCATCSHLEVLSFTSFYGINSLPVAGALPKLRTVNLVDGPSLFRLVDIDAPNLSNLHISSSCNSQHLTVINLTPCKTLQHLNLSAAAVTDEWLDRILPNLPNLGTFCLSSCSSLKSVKITSDRLKCLSVVACNNLIMVDVDAPNLLEFSSDLRFSWDFDHHLLPAFKLKVRAHLLEANLHLISEKTLLWTYFYPKLIRSLENFNHSKVVTLTCDMDKAILIPKDVRETLLPPPYGTPLLVKISKKLDNSVVDVVDSLLWVSPQLDTLSFQGNLDFKTLKCTYRDAADDEEEVEKPCCGSLPWKCWRHELKKVKLLNFTCVELPILRKYFLTDTNTLEIIEFPPGCSLCNPAH